MNLWLVNHYALPPSSSGITRHHDLAARLGRRGFDVSVVASSYDHYSRTDRLPPGGPDVAVEVTDGVRYCWIRTPGYADSTAARSRNMVTFATRLARQGPRLHLPRPDVIIGSSPHLLAPLGARTVARKLGAAFIMEVRDLWPDSLVDLGGPPEHHPATMVLRRIERSLYRSADHVISVLPEASERIAQLARRPVAVTWQPNGTTVPEKTPPARQAQGPIEVVYAGTIGNANALDVVVDAARLLERTHGGDAPRWRLVGPGPDAERLQRRATELGLESLRFEPPIAKVEIPDLLASADACLLHLRDSPVFRWGISPNKLFDYFAAARPVLFGVSTPDDAVARAQAGFSFRPEDPEDLADAAMRLAKSSDEERARMGARGFEYLAGNHDIEALSDRLAAVIENVAGTC